MAFRRPGHAARHPSSLRRAPRASRKPRDKGPTPQPPPGRGPVTRRSSWTGCQRIRNPAQDHAGVAFAGPSAGNETWARYRGAGTDPGPDPVGWLSALRCRRGRGGSSSVLRRTLRISRVVSILASEPRGISFGAFTESLVWSDSSIAFALTATSAGSRRLQVVGAWFGFVNFALRSAGPIVSRGRRPLRARCPSRVAASRLLSAVSINLGGR